MNSSYSDFAAVYDRLTENVNYSSIADFIIGVFDAYGINGKDILDVACGTGTLMCELISRGYELVGADASEQMLAEADTKLFSHGMSARLLNQKMQSLDLYGTVNAAVCTLDAVNHLPSASAVNKLFGKLRLFIEPEGLFVFDVNTAHKHRDVLANNTFVYDLGDIFCVWQNELVGEKLKVDISLDIFTDNGKGLYNRYSEDFSEYFYSDTLLNKLLKDNGFELLACRNGYSESEELENAERLVYTARRLA